MMASGLCAVFAVGKGLGAVVTPCNTIQMSKPALVNSALEPESKISASDSEIAAHKTAHVTEQRIV